MRFFKEIEVAEVCYLSDAVRWIVRGQVPEFTADDRGYEIRGNLGAFIEEYHIDEDPLSALELEHFQVGLSYEDYLEHLDGYDDTPFLPLPDPLTEAASAQWRIDLETQRAEGKERVKAKLRDHLASYDEEVERAKIRVMSAILEKRLSVRGFWAESIEELYDDQVVQDAIAEAIPVDAISPALFQWDEHKLLCRANRHKDGRSGAYYLVTLDTWTMLQAFAAPHTEQREMAVLNGNALLRADTESGPQVSVKRQGRPPKAPWLRDGMRAWFGEQCRKGNLGIGKVEADLAAAVAWAASCGVSVARSTAQIYLSDLLKAR